MKISYKLLCMLYVILAIGLSFPSLASIQVINKHQNAKLTFSVNDKFNGTLGIDNRNRGLDYVYFDEYRNKIFISSYVTYSRYDGYEESGYLHKEFAVSPMVYCAYYNGYDDEYEYVSKSHFARDINYYSDLYLTVHITDDVVYFMDLTS